MSTATGEVKAGRAYVEILLDQTKLERGLKQAQKKIRAFGANLTSIGKNLLAVSGIMAAPLAFATKGFADFGDAQKKNGRDQEVFHIVFLQCRTKKIKGW